LLIDVQTPPTPIAPETVAVIRLLPNGVLQETPPQPIHPPNPIAPPNPIHELFPPGVLRGWLRAADVRSSEVIVPPQTGGGGRRPRRRRRVGGVSHPPPRLSQSRVRGPYTTTPIRNSGRSGSRTRKASPLARLPTGCHRLLACPSVRQ